VVNRVVENERVEDPEETATTVVAKEEPQWVLELRKEEAGRLKKGRGRREEEEEEESEDEQLDG